MTIYYFMLGIPGSGKTTKAVSLGCGVVCPDEIRETFNVDSPAAFEIAFAEVRIALRNGEDVVFDATNTLRRWRVDSIAAGRPHADKVFCVWMDTPLEVCIARHHERMRQGIRMTLPDSVIVRMSQQLADNPPELYEGFDEIVRIQPHSN